ncbi:TonB-dependent receptor [Rhodohalobacter sp. SW132]|uniref:TonB-dependent receptor n=1 Tax=Rhodohalobacter sp. SW132 TaxID=2293433 RepID=UPI000E26D349|nr:TonB-dependent receptor [Rhodohalobacter sp. SW132]REL38122.1 TonB-dependent receptor [Rhodohalobacter sp. SW132]
MAKKFTEIIYILFLLVFALFSTASFGQDTGDIRGTVTDAVTGETLIGVNLMIEGSSQGTATNVSGEYVIRRVPAGTHNLVVTYIGYQRIVEEIEVTAGETLEVDFVMQEMALEGAEVVVTTQARGQRSAINEQISSRSITNVVSADKIRELPDDNAATALSRLPGISLQDGDKVVIRGMQARYNQVMVNGVSLPSTSDGDRSTNLGFISSNMLAGIEVTKALRPDMDANSLGGVVNLRLQEAPEGVNSDVMLQGTYNTQDQTSRNYQTWASVSNRFFENRLGVFVQGNARRFDGGGESASATWERLGSDPGYGLAPYGMSEFTFRDNISVTEEYGGSVLMDYRIPTGSIKLQNTYAYTELDQFSHFDHLLLGNGGRQVRAERDNNNRHLLVNALQVESDFDIFKVDFGVSHSASQKETGLRYAIEFPISNAFPSFGESQRRQLTPADIYDITFDEDRFSAMTAGNGSTRDEYFQERQIVANLNVTVPVQITRNISGDFKTGAKVNYLSRENDVTRYFARLSEGSNNAAAADFLSSIGVSNPNSALRFTDFQDQVYPTGRGSYFLQGDYRLNQVIRSDYMDQYMTLAPTGWGSPHVPDSRRFDYDANETLSAAYVMADLDIGSRLSLLFGARYEHFNMDYEGSFVLQTQFTGQGQTDLTNPELDTLNTANRSVDHFLPNLQLRYKFTDWLDLRLAYTRTLSRPNYNQLMPSIFIASDGGTGDAGNPTLEPTVSNNYDAYLSIYENRIGLFTVGGFYKHVDGVILSNQFQRRNLPENIVWPSEDSGLPRARETDLITTFSNNPNPAHVYGLEFEWQTIFWYLPRPLDSMVLNVNYTRTWSEMDYRQIRNVRQGFDPIDFQPILVEQDTARSGRLEQQGNHIVNVALGSDYRGFSGRISFRMQADVLTGLATRPELDTFTGNIYGWDFTIRQQLPLEGLSLFLNGMNITHSPTENFREFRRESDGEVLSNLSAFNYNPRRFELGIRYSF